MVLALLGVLLGLTMATLLCGGVYVLSRLDLVERDQNTANEDLNGVFDECMSRLEALERKPITTASEEPKQYRPSTMQELVRRAESGEIPKVRR